MRDDREVRMLLGEIANLAPRDAIREAAVSLRALSPQIAADPPAALRLLVALDDACSPHLRELCNSYIDERPQPGRNDLFELARGFWSRLAESFAELLPAAKTFSDEARSELCARLIRASTEDQRWGALHYGPFAPQHWARVGRAWLAATEVGQHIVRLRADWASDTSVEREYLRAIAFSLCVPGALDEVQIEQAWRLIHYLLPLLELRRTRGPDTLYSIDPEEGQPPLRGDSTAPDSRSRRYFAAPGVAATFKELEQALHAGALPPLLDVPAPEAAIRFAPMLHHLLQYWSAEPPVRGRRRHPMPAKLRVVAGMENVVECLSGASDLPFASWDQLDANLHGIGARAELTDAQPLRVGMMVALLREDSGQWLVGVVRRMMRITNARAFIGVEFLSWRPAVVRASDGTREVRALLLDMLHKAATLRVALPLGTPRDNAHLRLLDQGETVELAPVELLAHARDYEIRSYRLRQTESAE